MLKELCVKSWDLVSPSNVMSSIGLECSHQCRHTWLLSNLKLLENQSDKWSFHQIEGNFHLCVVLIYLQVVCTLGTVVFVSILLIRGIWTGVTYLQVNQTLKMNGFDDENSAWNNGAQPASWPLTLGRPRKRFDLKCWSHHQQVKKKKIKAFVKEKQALRQRYKR